jgi:hypothetical protein
MTEQTRLLVLVELILYSHGIFIYSSGTYLDSGGRREGHLLKHYLYGPRKQKEQYRIFFKSVNTTFWKGIHHF